jgi:putative spermidine/putrescine transport system ATP-binding protein
MSGVVALEDVTFRYPGGKAGIFDLSLAIAPGELVVCIGPSGCGKTTLLKLIAGFLRPDRGTVRIAGEDVTQASVRSRELGIVFQAYALFPHMTVRENVAYPLRVRGIEPAARRARAEETLEMVGLAGLGDRLPAELSGGQQQRVALARALSFKPRALLLDEPLSALDAATRVAMRDEVRRIQRSQNIAALLITHDQDEALSLADRIAILREGRLVQTAPPHAIYDRPADGFVAGFVGRANLVPGKVSGADRVDTPFGALATASHGRPQGSRVLVLIRPERLEVVPSADGVNTFAVEVTHDRFFGATRQIDLACRGTPLRIETLSRGEVRYVRVPPEAVQFLAAT